MSKRKKSHSRSRSGKPSGKPSSSSSGSSKSLFWIFVALVVVVGGGLIFVKLLPPSKLESAAGIPGTTNANSDSAANKPPPTPAPAAPEIKRPETNSTDVAGAAPPTANIDTNSLSDMLNLGNWYLERDQPPDAEKAYRRAVEINPDDEDAHFNLGISLARQQRYDEAVKEYEATLAIYPDYLEAKNNLANALIKLDRTNDAIAQLEEALLLDPDYVQGLNNLGRLRAVQQDWDKAVTLLEHAREIDPKDFEVQFNLGNVYLQRTNTAAAVKAFETARELKPDNLLALNFLAKSLAMSGKAGQALNLLNQELARHPDSPELLYNTALLQLGAGQPAIAVSQLQKVVKLAPSFTPAREALKQAEEAAAKAATPPDLKSGK